MIKYSTLKNALKPVVSPLGPLSWVMASAILFTGTDVSPHVMYSSRASWMNMYWTCGV